MVTENDHLKERHIREAKRTKQILWSVIYLAIEDASCRPLPERPLAKSITAMRFLTSNMDVYLERLDVDKDVFRRRLLELMYSEKSNSKYTDVRFDTIIVGGKQTKTI
jgi:hypothetical protein